MRETKIDTEGDREGQTWDGNEERNEGMIEEEGWRKDGRE